MKQIFLISIKKFNEFSKQEFIEWKKISGLRLASYQSASQASEM